jgi:Leucine-rich repeat (LRR) protein
MTIENINQIDYNYLKTSRYIDIRDFYSTSEQIEMVLKHCHNELYRASFQCDNLKRIPDELFRFKNLTEIIIYTIQDFDISGIDSFENLYSLRFQANKLISKTPLNSLKNFNSLVIKVNEWDFDLNHFGINNNIQTLNIELPTIQQIDDSNFDKFDKLQYLTFNAPLQTLNSLKKCTSLKYISAHGTKLKEIDIESVFNSSISNIHISTNETLEGEMDFSLLDSLLSVSISGQKGGHPLNVKGLGNNPNLTAVSFSNLQSFPEDLKNCKGLTSIMFHHSRFNKLPDWIINFQFLRSISITESPLSEVPSDWSNLKLLETVFLYNNRLKDVKFIYTIPNLKSSALGQNPIEDTLFMLDKGKMFSEYRKEWFEFKALSSSKDILSFMSALGKSGLAREEKEWFFYQFQNKSKISILPDWGLDKVFQSLLVPFKILNERATEYLLNIEQNKISIAHFVKGSVCFLDGNFTEKKTTIKEKLTTLDIKTVTEYNSQVSHIIIGQKPVEATTIYKENNPFFLLEHQLYQIIKNVGQEEKFLIQEEVSGEVQMADSLKQLLGSNDANSVQIGLEMLKTGGIPASISDELLLLCKTFDDAKIRAEARKILEVQVPMEWVGILKDKQTFIDVPSMKEKEIREKLQKIALSIGGTPAYNFAMLLFKYHQKGLAFVLANYGLHSKEREIALEALTQNGYFDFHRGIGYHNWKNTSPDDVILSKVDTGIAFPSDHPNPKAIKTINMHNCKFDKLHKDIEIFENLEILDLSVNNLTGVNPNISKLNKLKHLNLSLNRLTNFPKAVEGMAALRVLDLRYNSSSAYKVGGVIDIKIPDSFKKTNPDCEVLL